MNKTLRAWKILAQCVIISFVFIMLLYFTYDQVTSPIVICLIVLYEQTINALKKVLRDTD